MKTVRISILVFSLCFTLMSFSGCKTTSSASSGQPQFWVHKEKRMDMTSKEFKETIIGEWKVADAGMESYSVGGDVNYIFNKDGTCLKKSVFEGYNEDKKGTYALIKKEDINHDLKITYEDGINEDYEIFFPNMNNMKAIARAEADDLTIIYRLERVSPK